MPGKHLWPGAFGRWRTLECSQNVSLAVRPQRPGGTSAKDLGEGVHVTARVQMVASAKRRPTDDSVSRWLALEYTLLPNDGLAHATGRAMECRRARRHRSRGAFPGKPVEPANQHDDREQWKLWKRGRRCNHLVLGSRVARGPWPVPIDVYASGARNSCLPLRTCDPEEAFDLSPRLQAQEQLEVAKDISRGSEWRIWSLRFLFHLPNPRPCSLHHRDHPVRMPPLHDQMQSPFSERMVCCPRCTE